MHALKERKRAMRSERKRMWCPTLQICEVIKLRRARHFVSSTVGDGQLRKVIKHTGGKNLNNVYKLIYSIQYSTCAIKYKICVQQCHQGNMLGFCYCDNPI